MTRNQAMIAFRKLVAAHGLHWRADVPASAHDELRKINAVLTEQDRREALGLRN